MKFVHLALTCSLASRVAAAGIGGSPMTAIFESSAGRVATQVFKLKNTSGFPVRIEIDCGEMQVDSSGARHLVPPSDGGVGSWLDPPPKLIEIPANGTGQFTGRAVVPSGATLGTHVGVFRARIAARGDQGAATGQKSAAVGVTAVPELGFMMLLRVGRAEGGPPVVSDCSVKSSVAGPQVLACSVANPNLYDVQVAPMTILLGDDRRPVGRFGGSPLLLLPGERRPFVSIMGIPLPVGKHEAIATFSGGESAVARVEFQVVEPTAPLPMTANPALVPAPDRIKSVPETEKQRTTSRSRKTR